jgi:hypothetical protein
MLGNLDIILNTFGAWDECDVQFRYLTALPIIVVGRVANSTLTAFWGNHLAGSKPMVFH